jgi:anti-anti-sigma factor
MLRTVPTQHPRGFRLIGELDVSNFEELSAFLAAHVDADAPLALDLSGVTFMDSSGLKVIYRLARLARERGAGPVELRSPAPQVRRLFDLALPADVPGIEVRSA